MLEYKRRCSGRTTPSMLSIYLRSSIFEKILGSVSPGVDLRNDLDGLFLDLRFQGLGLSEGVIKRAFDVLEVDLGG